MNLLDLFIEFLFSQKNRPSKLTVKNYKADVRQFISWFEGKFKKVFEPSSVTPQLIQIYKQESTSLSASSIDRHLSSLRKFFSFLKLEGLVSKSPFDVALDKSQVPNEDPYKLKGFKNFLYIYNASHLTIKNYIIDIKQFFRWAEEATAVKDAWNLKDKNIFNRLDGALVEEYKNRLAESGISPVSINRKLSSLRRYFSWAASEKLIPSVSYQVSRISDTKKTQECKTEPAQNALRPSSAQASYSRIPPVRLLQKTIKGFGFLFDSLAVTPTAKTIEQGKYILWKIRGRPIFREMSNVKSRTQGRLGIGNYRKAFYAPLTISTKYFPMHKKLWFHLRHTRPNWYRQYHSYPVTHYFHFAILIVFMSAMGFGLYQTFVQEPSSKNPALASGSSPIAPPRILSFQGRLTDASDNPITTSKLVRFQIYSDPTASGAGNLVWQEVDRISPDTDGIFSILLGNTVAICADPVAVATGACIIPQSIFAFNASLYLGVTIGNDPELTPRQQLATVAYATNAEVLQGMAPITDAGVTGNTNAILALNSSGVVSIAGTATTTFQSAGGQITLQGKVLALTTASGTDTNVQVIPDGLGKIDLQKPILNSTNSNNLATAVGSVEVDDLFSILATSSGQSALTINQDSTGPIISASVSGTAKFTVGNDGSGYFSGNLGVGTLVPLEDFDVTGNATISGTLAVATIKPPVGALNLQYKSGWDAWTTGITLQDNTGYVGIGPTAPAYKLDVSTSTANDRGINIAHTATTGTNYGVYSSVTGAATANYGGYFVSTGATSDYGVAIAAMTGATSTGLDIGALSGATDNKAINIGNITGTPSGSNYGINIGTIATATTNSYGIYIGGPAAAATNYAIYSNAAAKSYFNGNVGIGATSPLAALDVRGSSGTGPVASISANTSYAALVVDNGADMGSLGDLITASSAASPSQSPSGGGTTRTQFRVTNGGSIYARAFYDLDNSTMYLDPAATGTSLSVAGAIVVPGTTTFNTIAYTWPGSDGTDGFVLKTNGTGTLSWVAQTGGGGSGLWKATSPVGAYVPINNTVDVLIGGDATTSAKFSFINVSKGTPTASVSAVSAGTGVSIVGDGTIQSLLSGNLTIGGDTTGNIIFAPNNTTTATFKPNILQFTNAATIDSTGTLSLNTLNSQLVTLGGSIQINGGGITSNGAAISIDSGAGNSVTLGSGDVFNLSGNLAQTGVTTFSTGTGLISINGNFNTSLIPNATDYNLGSPTNYWGTVYASNFVSPVGGGTSGYWTLTSNVLAPVSTMFDLVVGGTATSSAKFQAFANSVGDITAGDASTSANLAFSGASTTHNVEILDAGNLNFATSVGGQGASGANLTSRLYIKNTGSIGIGTTTPTTGFVFDTVGRGRFSTGLSVGTTTTTNPVEIVGAVNQATGQVTLGGNLDAASGADVTGADLTVGGANFSVGQATGNITTAGTITLPNANSLTGVASYVQFNNGVSIGGGTTYVINATTSNLNSLTLNATLSTNQGGADGTKTIIDASGNVVPGAADSSNLGAADKEWNNLYVKQIISPATGGIAGYWQLNSSVLSPTNIVNDLAIGGTSTSSAKFQVFGTTIGDITTGDASSSANLAFSGAGTTHNVEILDAGNLNFATSVGGQGASGANLTSRLYIHNYGNVGIGTTAPLAKLDVNGAASLSGNLTFSGARTIASQAMTSLTIGDSNTGNVILNPGGSIGIKTTDPLATLDIRGGSGTIPAASVSAQSSFAAMVVDNKGLGDIFTASSSGLNRFVITQNGNVGIGTNVPGATLAVTGNELITADSVTTGKGLDISVDGLTSGIGLNIQSTSTSLEAGKLISADQTATYTSSKTVSGNVLNLSRALTINAAAGSLTQDVVSTGIATASATLTFSHTTGTGDNRYLIVGVASSRAVSGVTYGGTSMDSIGTHTYSSMTASQWGIKNPASGANNIVVTLSGGTGNIQAGGISFTNVDQTSPTGTFAYGEGAGTTATATVTSAASDIVVDVVALAGAAIPNVGAGQTVQWRYIDTSLSAGGSTEAGAASVAMTWTWSGSKIWSAAGVSIQHATTVPLTISGNLAALSSNCTVTVGSCNDSASVLSLTQSYSSATGAVLKVANSGTGPAATFTGGSIGIGTTSPLATIDVRGNSGTGPVASISANTSFAALVVDNGANMSSAGDLITASSAASPSQSPSGGGNSRTQFRVTNGGSIYARSFYDLDNSTYYLDPAATGTSLIVNGNVGIGNSSPLVKLDVTGSASLSANLSLRGDGTAHTFNILDNGSLNFNTSVGGDAALNTTLYLGNGSAGKGGNIGIGTTTPVGVLDLTKTVPMSGTDILYGIYVDLHRSTADNGGTNYGAYISSQTDNWVGDTNYGLYATAIKPRGGGTGGQYGIYGTAQFLDNGGAQTLDNAYGVTGQILVNTDTNNGIVTSAYSLFAAGNTVAAGDTIGTNYGLYVQAPSGAGTVSNKYAIITEAAAGNVGIGNLTPLTALDVTGSASLSANLSLRGAGTAHTFNILDNGSLNFNTSVGGDAALNTTLFIGNGAAAGSGKVGIGTTTPLSSLDIAGGTMRFSNVTSNTIFFGTAGVAAPADSSAGEKIQLYGTAGTVGSTDYALGIETNNLWLNSGSAYKIYSAGTLIGNISSAGALESKSDILAGSAGGTRYGGIVYSYSAAAGNRAFKMDAVNSVLNLSNDHMTIRTSTAAKYIVFNSGGTSTSMVIDAYSGTTPGGVYLNGGLALGVHNTDGSYSGQFGALSNWLHSHLTGVFGCADAEGCIVSNGDFIGDGSDLAEWYPSDGQVTSGYLVSISSEGSSKVEKSQKSYDKKIIGIISTDPGYQLGSPKENEEYGEIHEDTFDPDKNSLVALSGRVPTFVSTINGPIKAGDPITSSDTPGVGMKATKAGPIVGKALEDYENHDPNVVGKIEVFVNIGVYDPDNQLATTNSFDISKISDSLYQITDSLGNVIDRVGVFAELAVANLRVGFVNAEEIAVNSVAVATENVTIGGQNIRDYIVSVVNSAINNGDIVTPIASSDVIHTNLISPLASDNGNIAIRLGANSSTSSSRLEIQNASGSAVATIDSSGNASFSGSLAVEGSTSVSGNLSASEASIAGTLRADRIIANDIEGLNARIATIAAEQVASNKYYVASDSGILDTNYLVQNTNGYVDIASLSGQLAYVDNLNATFATFTQGLMSFGPSSLSDVSITGQLSVGSQLILADNSINVLGSDLQIQPLRQGGVSFLSGLVHIDTNGNLTVSGDLTVGGKLATNIISPLPDKDLTIQNASGSSVLAVNQLGDLIASGAGTFSKINLNPVAPALAVSDSEIIATGSAGVATISAQRAQLTIQNSAVTDKSLIYITPIGDTQNQVLYLMRQVPGVSFTVGVGSAPTKEIPFNWIIVN